MRRIFTLCFVVLGFVTFKSSAQCGSVLYNFDAGLTNGFTASGSTTGLTNAGTNLKLGNVAAGTILLTTPTLKLPGTPVPGTSLIDGGFTWANAGNAGFSGLTVTVQYVKNTGVIGTFGPLAVATPLTSPICKADITVPVDIATTGFSAYNYQLIYTFTTSGNGNNGTFLSIDNYTTFSSISSVVLPVGFSSLDATAINNSISLKWAVGTENNVTGYEIQKSIDGHDYANIGFVNATGQSSYSFVDTRTSTTAYYRIKSVDVNGRYTYSPIATVKEGKSMIQLKAFPSPFTKNVSVQHATAGAGSLITISSEDGRLIKSIAPIIGTQQTQIDLSTAKAGLYLIRFNNNNGTTETLKVVKQ
jgi:hypothetical protein